MRPKRRRLIWVFLMMLFVSAVLVSAQTAVKPLGSGAAGDPYLVSTLDNLAWVSQNSQSWGGCFKQTADIDASMTGAWNNGLGFSPIGSNIKFFSGRYDGNGHVISHLSIIRDSIAFAGLFGAISGPNCLIFNLSLSDATVRGKEAAGLLVGYGDSAAVYYCRASGSVIGMTSAGGLCGEFIQGAIMYCSSSGSVTTTRKYALAGGLVGFTSSSVSDCFSLDTVYARGDTSTVGGLIGSFSTNYSRGTVENSYCAGPVMASGINSETGGLIGDAYLSAPVFNCFWDIQSSGIDTSKGGVGKTTAEMMSQSSFTKWYFDYIWTMSPGGYPCLRKPSDFWPSGSGTAGDPYQIASLANLLWLSQHKEMWGKSFFQTNDIDASPSAHWASDSGWSPIGIRYAPFSGTYNGNGKTISGLALNRYPTAYIGMFGFARGAGCVIQDVNLTNVNFVMQSSSPVIASGINGLAMGGIVGRLSRDAKLSCCSCNGSVTGPPGQISIGGLAGIADTSSIANCCCNCIVSARYLSIIGGLIGYSLETSIINSYSSSKIVTDSVYKLYCGGLIGFNYSQDALIITSCYWDKQAFGMDTSKGGIGKSTSEMKTQSTFTGWNFNYTWAIKPGGYPYLLPPETLNPAIPSGSGSADSPYLIATLDNLAWLAQNDDQWGKCFKQTTNIDASATAGWESGYGWSPIGNEVKPFTGVYDGNGMAISDLTIKRPITNYVGLFGHVSGKSCRLTNVFVSKASISGAAYVGAIAGKADSISISGCRAGGSVASTAKFAYVGGLIGGTYISKITNCHYSDTVNGGPGISVGGLIGSSTSDSIADCGVTGVVISNSVDVNSNVGGVVGYCCFSYLNSCNTQCTINDSGTWCKVGGIIGYSLFNAFHPSIENCTSAGNITAKGGANWVGGLVGETFGSGPIVKSKSSCAITGSLIGGLVGRNYSTTLNQCCATGTLTGNALQNTIGGIAYSNFFESGWNSITNCYSLCPIVVDVSDTNTVVRGLIASTDTGSLPVACYHAGPITLTGKPYSIKNEYGKYCFWDKEAAGKNIYADSGLLSGFSTAQMKTQSTYANAAWDFATVWQIDPAINNGYPSFKWENTQNIGRAALPNRFSSQAFIRIFNQANSIVYYLPEAAHVSMKIFNCKGACVAALVNDMQTSGRHTLFGAAKRLGAGRYLMAFTAGNFNTVRSFTVVR